jgi:hypothetical protein
MSEGYINLGTVAGLSQERDTSSCASISFSDPFKLPHLILSIMGAYLV